ncbi:MAG: YdeI/OmpD-associated family protein [Isosphaeraceae bacterium]
MKQNPDLHFFETPSAMREWLEANHRKSSELHVGFYKRHAVGDDTPSITWAESVAEALCFGWIDGIRRTLNEDRYTIRFTPRRSGSKWSAANIRTMAELEVANKMTDAGRAVFEARKDSGSPGYRAQKKVGALDETRLREFQSNEPAWRFFESQPPGYQKAAAWWVMQAKREETRDRRLATLIELSAAGKRVL